MKGFKCCIDFPKPIGRKRMEKATAVLGNWMFLPKTAAGRGGTIEFTKTDLNKKKEVEERRKVWPLTKFFSVSVFVKYH